MMRMVDSAGPVAKQHSGSTSTSKAPWLAELLQIGRGRLAEIVSNNAADVSNKDSANFRHQSPTCKSEQRPLNQEDENPILKSEQRPLNQEDENPILKSEQRPLSLRDEHPIVKSEQRPLSQRDENPIVKSEQRPLSLRDENPIVKSEQRPLSLRDENPIVKSEQRPLSISEENFITKSEPRIPNQSDDKVENLISNREPRPLDARNQAGVSFDYRKDCSVTPMRAIIEAESIACSTELASGSDKLSIEPDGPTEIETVNLDLTGKIDPKLGPIQHSDHTLPDSAGADPDDVNLEMMRQWRERRRLRLDVLQSGQTTLSSKIGTEPHSAPVAMVSGRRAPNWKSLADRYGDEPSNEPHRTSDMDPAQNDDLSNRLDLNQPKSPPPPPPPQMEKDSPLDTSHPPRHLSESLAPPVEPAHHFSSHLLQHYQEESSNQSAVVVSAPNTTTTTSLTLTSPLTTTTTTTTTATTPAPAHWLVPLLCECRCVGEEWSDTPGTTTTAASSSGSSIRGSVLSPQTVCCQCCCCASCASSSSIASSTSAVCSRVSASVSSSSCCASSGPVSLDDCSGEINESCTDSAAAVSTPSASLSPLLLVPRLPSSSVPHLSTGSSPSAQFVVVVPSSNSDPSGPTLSLSSSPTVSRCVVPASPSSVCQSAAQPVFSTPIHTPHNSKSVPSSLSFSSDSSTLLSIPVSSSSIATDSGCHQSTAATTSARSVPNQAFSNPPSSSLIHLVQANDNQPAPFRLQVSRFLCDQCSLTADLPATHPSLSSSFSSDVTSPDKPPQNKLTNKRYLWFELSLQLLPSDGTFLSSGSSLFTIYQLFDQLSRANPSNSSVSSFADSSPSCLRYKCWACCQVVSILVVPDLLGCAQSLSLSDCLLYLSPHPSDSTLRLCSVKPTHSLCVSFELCPVALSPCTMVEQTQLVSPPSTGSGSPSSLLHHHHRNIHHYHLPHYRAGNHRYSSSTLVVPSRTSMTVNHHSEPPPQRPSSSVSSGSAGSKSDHSVTGEGDDLTTVLSSTGNSSLDSADSSSDYEYGPGIVDRLRHKFMALAKTDPSLSQAKLSVCANASHLLSSIIAGTNGQQSMKRCSSMEELTYHKHQLVQQAAAKLTPAPPAICPRIPKKNHQLLHGTKKRIVQWNLSQANGAQNQHLLQLNHIEPQINGFSQQRTLPPQPAPTLASNSSNQSLNGSAPATVAVEPSAKPTGYPSNIVKQYVKNQNKKHSALMLSTVPSANNDKSTSNANSPDSATNRVSSISPATAPSLSPNMAQSQSQSNNLVLLTSPIPYIKRSKSVETLSSFSSHALLQHLATVVDCSPCTVPNSNHGDSTPSSGDNHQVAPVPEAHSISTNHSDRPKQINGLLTVASLVPSLPSPGNQTAATPQVPKVVLDSQHSSPTRPEPSAVHERSRLSAPKSASTVAEPSPLPLLTPVSRPMPTALPSPLPETTVDVVPGQLQKNDTHQQLPDDAPSQYPTSSIISPSSNCLPITATSDNHCPASLDCAPSAEDTAVKPAAASPPPTAVPSSAQHHYQIRDSEMPKADIVKTYKRLFEPIVSTAENQQPVTSATSALSPTGTHSSPAPDSCTPVCSLPKTSQASLTANEAARSAPTVPASLHSTPPPNQLPPPPPIPTRILKPVLGSNKTPFPRATTSSTTPTNVLFNGKVSTRPTPPIVPKRNLPVTGTGNANLNSAKISTLYKRPGLNGDCASTVSSTTPASASPVNRFSTRNSSRPTPACHSKLSSIGLKPVSSVVPKTAPPIPTSSRPSQVKSVSNTSRSLCAVSSSLSSVPSAYKSASRLTSVETTTTTPTSPVAFSSSAVASSTILSSPSPTASPNSTATPTTAVSTSSTVSKTVSAKASDTLPSSSSSTPVSCSSSASSRQSWSSKSAAPSPPLLPSPSLSPLAPSAISSQHPHHNNNHHNSHVVKKKPVANIRPFQSELPAVVPTSCSESSTNQESPLVSVKCPGSSVVCATSPSLPLPCSPPSVLPSPTNGDEKSCAKMLLSAKSVASLPVASKSQSVPSAAPISKPETLKPSLLTGFGSPLCGVPLKSTLWSASAGTSSSGKSAAASAMANVPSSQSSSSSMVFDFRDKDVKPNIAIQPTPFGAKPIQRHLIQQIGGVDPTNYEDDFEDSNYCGTMQPPPPSGITFLGENDVHTAPSALLVKRNKNLSLKFNDSATSTHKYIVEVYDSDSEYEEDPEPETAHSDDQPDGGPSPTNPDAVPSTDEQSVSSSTPSAASSLSSNSTVLQNKFLTGSSNLATYKPASSQIDRSFQLGITKSTSNSNAPTCDKSLSSVADCPTQNGLDSSNGPDTASDDTSALLIKPTPVEQTVTFSQSTTASDLLF